LEATYAGSPLKPTSPATEEQLTMVPLPCLSISEFHVACRAKSLSGLWQWFYPNFPLQSAVGAESPSIPALLKHNQSPKVAMVFSTMAFTSALFETSHLIK
jgi:hypothetical protein